MNAGSGRIPFPPCPSATGTCDADGTVNLETAKRMGWDKNWRDAGVANEER